MNAKIYSREGKEQGDLELPESVFGVAWNADLVHGVVVAMQGNARANTAHTKDRSEVSGGGKKPWRQKGTGRARHGSSRSPIWTKGGVAHGPRNERDYTVKLNKKVRAKALAAILSKKFADGEVIFLDALTFAEPRSKEAKTILSAVAKGTGHDDLATKRKNAALIVLPDRNEITEKSFRNFSNLAVMQAKDINPVDVLTYKYVIVAESKSALEVFKSRVAQLSAGK